MYHEASFLRTLRDSFPSQGSSIPEGKPLWSHRLMLKVCTNFAIITYSHNAFWRKTHQLTKGRRHLLFFLKMVLSVFSQRNTGRTSAPFRTGQSLNPYPPHYKTAFASSDISGPHLQQCALRFHLPLDKLGAKIRGFHVPHNCRL